MPEKKIVRNLMATTELSAAN